MINIQKNIPLAPLTTFRIGGPAKFFVEARTKEEIKKTLEWAGKNGEPVFILAGGSNVLISDKGVEGLVVKVKCQWSNVNGQRMTCGAGMLLAQAVKAAADNNLAGLEWAVAIPGTVGGAVAGNIGAYGRSIGELVESAEVLREANPHTKNFGVGIKWEFQKISNKNFAFGYKTSIYKNSSVKDAGIIWQIVLNLKKGEREEIENLMKKYLEHRGKTQPKAASAGCIFKNIALANLNKYNANLANQVEEERGVHPHTYAMGVGVKNGMISAGWIIDQLGLKGKTIGGAKISQDHANFIVNTGSATAEDVITLISFIKQQARDKFGMQLHEEIVYLGF